MQWTRLEVSHHRNNLALPPERGCVEDQPQQCELRGALECFPIHGVFGNVTTGAAHTAALRQRPRRVGNTPQSAKAASVDFGIYTFDGPTQSHRQPDRYRAKERIV